MDYGAKKVLAVVGKTVISATGGNVSLTLRRNGMRV
jgi:hypothetical protein